MKHILISLTSMLAVTASAQLATTKKEVYCDKTETMISVLKGQDFEESPIWFGTEKDSKTSNYSLFVNQQTKTWTIIQFNKETACVLGSGEDFIILSKKSYI